MSSSSAKIQEKALIHADLAMLKLSTANIRNGYNDIDAYAKDVEKMGLLCRELGVDLPDSAINSFYRLGLPKRLRQLSIRIWALPGNGDLTVEEIGPWIKENAPLDILDAPGFFAEEIGGLDVEEDQLFGPPVLVAPPASQQSSPTPGPLEDLGGSAHDTDANGSSLDEGDDSGEDKGNDGGGGLDDQGNAPETTPKSSPSTSPSPSPQSNTPPPNIPKFPTPEPPRSPKYTAISAVKTKPKALRARVFTESKAGQEVLKLFELDFLSEPSEKTIELSGQLNVAHQEATKKDKSISELSGKLNIAHQEATKKDKSISELSGRLNVAHQEATKKAKSISELSGTLNDMQLELAHIKSDLNSANDQKRELQKALKEFNSDLDSKEQHLQSTRSQLVFEKAEHERLATEVDVKNGIINELQGRTEEAVRRIEDSEKELTQLRGERATLKASQQEATQVREAKAALATQLKASHAELDKLRGENALLDNHLKDSKNELTQLREEKMTFGVKLNSFERNAIECAEAKSTLESNLDASKGEVLRLGANKTKLEADKVALGQELQTTKAEANSDVEKLREKLELAETKIQELSMTHDEQLQSQSATMERERNAAIKALRERLERECSSLATKHIQDLEVYHTRISQTRLQRDKYNNIINDLAAETSYHIALTEMGIIGDWRPYELQPTTSLNFEQSRFHGKVANMITLSNEIPKKIFQYMWTRQQGGLIDDDSLILDLWRTWEDSTAMTMDDRHRFFYTIYRFCFLLLKSPYTHQRHLDEWLACQLVIALANSGSPNNHHGLRMEILEDIQKVDRLKLTITGRMGLSHLERLLNPVANHKFPMHLSLPYEIEPTHTRQFYCCSQRSNQTWMVSWTEIETNLHLVLCPLEDAVIPRLPVIYHDDMTKFGFGWWGEFLYMIAMVGESTLSWRLLVRFDDEFHKWAEEHIVDSFPTALLTSAEET